MMTTRTRILAGSTVALLALTSLTGCGSKSSSASPAGQSTQGSQQGSGNGGNGYGGGNGNGYGRMPGVRGTIAEVDGATVQVQGASSQTAVTIGANTKVRLLNTVDRSALKTGECVQVTAPRSQSSQGSQGGQASASPTAAASGSPTSITAGTVVITAATNGSCQTGTGRRNASARPSSSWTPSANGSNGNGSGGYGGYYRGANGLVTDVQGDTFTVQQSRQGTTSTVTVTTDGSTTYQQQVAGTKTAIKTGQCMTAIGPADSTGAVAATQVVVSSPVNGSCTTGLGRGNR